VDVEEGAAERLAEREAKEAEGASVRVGADALASALGEALGGGSRSLMQRGSGYRRRSRWQRARKRG
jgi:hypothetical protein